MSDINYLDPGQRNGKPVLFIHGLGVDGSSWILQFPALIAAGYRPIAIDVPGFGNSPHGKKKWSIARVTQDIADLLLNKNYFPINVVGLSMGGTIAQQLTLEFPDLVSKLVLANTFSILKPTSFTGWFYFLQRFILVHTLGLKIQSNLVSKRIFPHPEQEYLRNEMISQIRKADPRAYRAAMRSLGLFNSRKRLHEINVPTLVITGAKDTTIPPSHQSSMSEWIPGARQVIMLDAGHAASVEFPMEFNRILLDFLSE